RALARGGPRGGGRRRRGSAARRPDRVPVGRGRGGLRGSGSLRRGGPRHELARGALDRRHVMWDRLASLPLEVEGYTLEKLTGGERITTLVRLRGGDVEGVGEEIGLPE